MNSKPRTTHTATAQRTAAAPCLPALAAGIGMDFADHDISAAKAPHETSSSTKTETATDFLITDAATLCQFAKLVNTGSKNTRCNAVVTQDFTYSIDADGDWKGISINGRKYGGTFDGQGHTITLIAPLREIDPATAGLFDCVEAGGVVKNITLTGLAENNRANISNGSGTHSYAAGIVNRNEGTVTNCHVKYLNVTINIDLSILASSIVGYNKGAINGCTATCCSVTTSCSQTSYDLYIGGITGSNNGTVIACATAACTVMASINFTKYNFAVICVGGIAGLNAGVQNSVQNSYATGNIIDGNNSTCCAKKDIYRGLLVANNNTRANLT